MLKCTFKRFRNHEFPSSGWRISRFFSSKTYNKYGNIDFRGLDLGILNFQVCSEGFQGFQGPLQAGFDPAQTRAFEAIENIPGSTAPLFDEATSFARSATTAPTDPAEVAAFMNPFLRNVTDIQKREAERVADVQEQKLGAQAAQAGAFGGSRASILEAERQRNLGQQLDDIEARGLAASFQDAQTRLGAQRAREAARHWRRGQGKLPPKH